MNRDDENAVLVKSIKVSHTVTVKGPEYARSCSHEIPFGIYMDRTRLKKISALLRECFAEIHSDRPEGGMYVRILTEEYSTNIDLDES